jgi:hypothetical protein
MSVRFMSMLAGAALIVGCASMGQNFNMSDVDAFKPGITTLSDAKEKLGKPYSESVDTFGRKTVIWVYSRGVLTTVQSKGVSIIFDRNEKMQSVVHKSSSEVN